MYSKIVQRLLNRKIPRFEALLDLTSNESCVVGYQHLASLDKCNIITAIYQLKRYALSRQGILLDKHNVIAQLGIDSESQDVDTLFRILEPLKYTGIFSGSRERWWQHRLWDWEREMFDDRLGNYRGKERVVMLNKALDLQLDAAISNWAWHSDGLYAYACDSCHQPTEDSHSVAAYDPLLHNYVYEKRICWHCIATGTFKKHGLEYNTDDQYIIDNIESNEFTCGDT